MKRRNYLTGEAARMNPAINKLQPRAVAVPLAKQVHDTSGVARSVRRGNR